MGIKKRSLNICGCGEIGRRARFRIWCCKTWGFESLHPHKLILHALYEAFFISFKNYQILEIVKESIDDLNAVIKVHLEADDLKPRVMKKLKEVAGKVSLKGFRPGKVPISVVKRMYGKGVMYDELNSTLNETLQGYIEDNNLNLLGRPLPVMKDELDLDLDFKTEYDFEYEVGLAPDFEVSFELKDMPPLYDVKIDDEYLDREVDNMLDRFGDMTNPEEAEEGDIHFGQIVEVVEETEPAEGEEAETPEGLKKMAALNPKHITNTDFVKSMIGKKVEDTFPISMLDFLKDEDEVKRFWELNIQGQKERDLSEEDVKEIMGKAFTFEVRKINRIVPAELNEELFKKVYGEDTDVTDEAGFRAKIAEENETFYSWEAERFYSSKSIDGMLMANPVALPDEFLKKFLIETNDKVTEENVEEQYEQYSKSMIWSLIVNKIQEANPEVAVEENDLIDQARLMAKTQYAQFTQGGNEALIESIVQYQLQDENTWERLFYDALANKVSAFIREKVAPPKEEISATGFLDKLKENK